MVRQRWSTPFFGQHIFSLESAHKQQKKRDIHSVTLTVIFSSSSNFACTLSGASSRIPLASRTITRNSCTVLVVVVCIVCSSSSSSRIILNVFLNFRVEKKNGGKSLSSNKAQKRNGREKRDFARRREQQQLLSLLLMLPLLSSYVYV